MKPGYHIEHGALHFDATVRSLHCEYDRQGKAGRVVAITDDGVIAVPWGEIPLMPCVPLSAAELTQRFYDLYGGPDAELR